MRRPLDLALDLLDRQLVERRSRRLCEQFAACGESSVVLASVAVYSAPYLTIGDRSHINEMTVIYAGGGVRIGDDVHVGAGCVITTTTHPIDADERRRGALIHLPVAINDGAWLGAGAIILPGVTVGRNAIVAAGAVVTRSVADDTTVRGVPAS